MAQWSPHLHRSPPPIVKGLAVFMAFLCIFYIVNVLAETVDPRYLGMLSKASQENRLTIAFLSLVAVVIYGLVLVCLWFGHSWARWGFIFLMVGCVCGEVGMGSVPVIGSILDLVTNFMAVPFIALRMLLSQGAQFVISSRSGQEVASLSFSMLMIVGPLACILIFVLPGVRLFYEARAAFARQRSAQNGPRVGRFK